MNIGFLQFLTASGGDWVIYLLIAFSIIAFAVIIERVVIVTRQYKYQEKTLSALTERLEMGPKEALKSEGRKLVARFELLDTLKGFPEILGLILSSKPSLHPLEAVQFGFLVVLSRMLEEKRSGTGSDGISM